MGGGSGPALHCHVMDGRGRLAFTLTKRTCFNFVFHSVVTSPV